MEKNILHLKAPGNWVNDPNGFLFYKGNYHLFYQHFPYAPRWGTMHWGHAVSKDLVHWEHKGIALFPTKREDQNGCFSGSAVEHDGKMHIFYTGVRYEVPDPEDIHVCVNDRFESSQLMITSEDGMHFDNFHDKKVIIPAITDKKVGDRTHTRDPKVWRGKDAWYMVLGSKSEESGKLLFYRSENLSDWTYMNQTTTSEKLGWMWECPDYFETENGQVLVFSPMGIMEDGMVHENHTLCTSVEFEEKTCSMNISDSYQFLDYGLDLYAPQSTVDADGNRVLVAWLRMPEAVEGKWNGMFCMPRVVEVKNGHIYFRLHPNVKKAFCKKIETTAQAARDGYCISMELKEGASISVGGYRITRENGKILTDRSNVFPELKEYRMKFETPEVKEGFHLDIYAEKNMMEVYVNDGEYVISNAVYDLGEDIETEEGYTLFTVKR